MDIPKNLKLQEKRKPEYDSKTHKKLNVRLLDPNGDGVLSSSMANKFLGHAYIRNVTVEKSYGQNTRLIYTPMDSDELLEGPQTGYFSSNLFKILNPFDKVGVYFNDKYPINFDESHSDYYVKPKYINGMWYAQDRCFIQVDIDGNTFDRQSDTSDFWRHPRFGKVIRKMVEDSESFMDNLKKSWSKVDFEDRIEHPENWPDTLTGLSKNSKMVLSVIESKNKNNLITKSLGKTGDAEFVLELTSIMMYNNHSTVVFDAWCLLTCNLDLYNFQHVADTIVAARIVLRSRAMCKQRAYQTELVKFVGDQHYGDQVFMFFLVWHMIRTSFRYLLDALYLLTDLDETCLREFNKDQITVFWSIKPLYDYICNSNPIGCNEHGEMMDREINEWFLKVRQVGLVYLDIKDLTDDEVEYCNIEIEKINEKRAKEKASKKEAAAKAKVQRKLSVEKWKNMTAYIECSEEEEDEMNESKMIEEEIDEI
jgi:hypothetical protein